MEREQGCEGRGFDRVKKANKGVNLISDVCIDAYRTWDFQKFSQIYYILYIHVY